MSAQPGSDKDVVTNRMVNKVFLNKSSFNSLQSAVSITASKHTPRLPFQHTCDMCSCAGSLRS